VRNAMRVDPAALEAAAKTCESVAAPLGRQLSVFAAQAAPTFNCFGLVEGVSDDLAAAYQEFYDEVCDYAGDLNVKLAEAGTGLRHTAAHYVNGDLSAVPPPR
jgi:hypothetical protein